MGSMLLVMTSMLLLKAKQQKRLEHLELLANKDWCVSDHTSRRRPLD